MSPNEGDRVVNKHVTFTADAEAPLEQAECPAPRRRRFDLLRFFGRAIRGGDISDARRLPRYLGLFLLAVAAIWGAIVAYLNYAPVRYTSSVSLILPGAGSTSSVNLSDLGQASSHSNSPYASAGLSPTVTYQRLLSSDRVLGLTADRLGLDRRTLGKPRVRLVDQTGLIMIEMQGDTPEVAMLRAEMLVETFLGQLETLRTDELRRREGAAAAPIREYESAVGAIRDRITELQGASGLMTVAQFEGIVADTESLAAEVRAVEGELALAAASLEALRTVIALSPESAALVLKLHADPEYRALMDAASEASAVLARARGMYGERHPTVVEARDAHSGELGRLYARAEAVTGLTRDQIASQIELTAGGERAALLAELVRQRIAHDGLSARLVQMRERLKNGRARVAALSPAAAMLDDLNRDYQVAEAVFASAIARLNTSRVDLYASYPMVQVLEAASPPQDPSSPRDKIAILAGIAATVCVIIALILGWIRRAIVDRILHTKEERCQPIA